MKLTPDQHKEIEKSSIQSIVNITQVFGFEIRRIVLASFFFYLKKRR